MRVIRTPAVLQTVTRRLHRRGRTIGFVPTMGALHAGHLHLIRRARRETAVVVVSIFVNPIQFNQRRDYSTYPRPLQHDLALCRAAGVDLVLIPSARELYPRHFQTFVEVTRLSRRWEGELRPGHFRGVATIVTKLLNLVQPTVAYFGEKDAQQARLIQQLALDLNIPTAIRVLPTVRESDGLAMSSRNAHLSPSERRRALVVFHALQAGQQLIESGIRRRAVILRRMRAVIRGEPRARLEYVAVVDPDTLEPATQLRRSVRLLVACRIGRVRLIDTRLVRGLRTP